MRTSVSARAKINLALNILGKREDGYHLLETVMQSVSLEDTITLSETEQPGEITLECASHFPGVPTGPENTAYRAAAEFFRKSGADNPGIHIRIKKRIPPAAGLGGGSADAAAVILGLDQLLQTDLDTDTLCRIGEAVGADVPFCIIGGTMLAEGIGSILTPLPPLQDCWILLAIAGQKPSTAEMYARYDASPGRVAADIRALTNAICEGDLPAAGPHLGNAFLDLWADEETLDIIRQMLESGALGASLSGSGPCVFGLFAQKQEAQACAAALRRSDEEVYLCRPEDTGCVLV